MLLTHFKAHFENVHTTTDCTVKPCPVDPQKSAPAIFFQVSLPLSLQ